jgi:alkyl sulfatase BDS1-like metallo-beta-lactamase superfamily hydrolase
MRNLVRIIGFLVLLAVLFLGAIACSKSKQVKEKAGAHPDLKAHSAEFKREVIKVIDGVYVAVGYALANSILLVGDDGVIVIDTTESEEAATEVKAAFDKITNKPVKAIVYTHFHADHCFGTTVFAGDTKPDIYSHESTLKWLDRIASVVRETTYLRASRQFGTYLPKEDLINCGIGPSVAFTEDTSIGLIRPNKTFSGEQTVIEVAGLKLHLVHAPGETDDQIFIWIPDKKLLLPADNYYKSFPNLYAIRGTAYRDVMKWVDSLDRMRALRPEILVPSHTRPIRGADTIYRVLTDYRDAIQFVHDQTIRGINDGLTPQQIVERVRLPAHLVDQPYLREYYGTVEWSVRAIYTGYLGWFGGNATDLFPLRSTQRAEKFVALAGGKEAFRKRVEEAAANGDHQWVLELTDQLLVLDANDKRARQLKARSLRALGEKQVASTARNYYLTQALETEGKVAIQLKQYRGKSLIDNIPLEAIFRALAVRLDPVKSADVEQIVGYRFVDTGEEFTVHVRRGVAEVQARFPDNPDIVVTTKSKVFKQIALQMRSPAAAVIKRDIQIEGGVFNLAAFMRMFQIK